VAILLVLAVMAGACGGDDGEGGAGGPTSSVPVDQTIEVSMVDIGFKPAAITVRSGTSVRFVFTNDGQLPHEAAFGDEATQQALAAGKAERDGPAVGPNKTRDYVRTFTTAGTLLIGCHVPGHYAAGMRIVVTVQ